MTDRIRASGETTSLPVPRLGGATRRLLAGDAFREADSELRHRVAMIHLVIFVGIANLAPLGIIAFVDGKPWLAIFDLVVALILGLDLVFLRRTGRYFTAAATGIGLAGALFLFLFATGGVAGTGHLWFYTFPLFAAFLLGSRRGAIASLILLFGGLVLLLLREHAVGAALFAYPREFGIRFVPSYLVVLAYSYASERLRETSHRRLIVKNRELGEAVQALSEKERALEAAQERLEQRVRDRTADLDRANVELRSEIRTRRGAEEEIRHAHDRFTTVLDSIGAWVYASDLETDEILFMNRPMQSVFGGDRIGEPCWKVVHGEGAPCARCPSRRLADSPGGNGETIHWEERNPVVGCWQLIHARAVRWVDGRRVRVQIATDITKRRSAEEENVRLQAELLQAQKMEALGTLAGGVAHDLNNLLTGLVGYPQLLLMDLPEDSPLRSKLERIQESGEQCARIVQDLLTLARRGVASPERVNLNRIVEGHLESPEHLAQRARHPDVVVETALDPATPEIMGSPHHLSNTLMNLVTNALEAMPSGGRLRIATRSVRLDRPLRAFTTIPPGVHAVLEVSDSGIGMAPDRVSRMFEPFFTTKVMGRSGTGLGMAVVWAVLQDHEGSIDVDTEEDRGTTMTLYFPVAGEERTPAPRKTQDVDYRGAGETVLVVDDVAEQRELARMILGRVGYRVETAASGEEALAHLATRPVDLLVLDMIMSPGIDGLETYRRALEIRPDQRAVIVSGFSESDRVMEAQRLGAGAYVQKPYLIQELGRAIRGELDRVT